MRYLITILAILGSMSCFGQSIRGVVLNKINNQPVENALVRTHKSSVISSSMGAFTLNNVLEGDTVRVSCLGYKPTLIKVKSAGSGPVTILLEPQSLMLKDVQVNRERNFKQDSIRNREENAAGFDYKSPGLKDMFITRSPYPDKNPEPVPTISTGSLLSVNLLSIAGIFFPASDPKAKFKKTLLANEEQNYALQRFNEKKVSQLTGLKSDSLKVFMDRYRPSVNGLKTMSDYDVLAYIKKCYAEFAWKK
ncbi:hypothetical protein GS399_10995 [Pedobacter sp. HMF7647]|uniref:Carboxypeptidase-like regulatory domain-containing protein n=1 Tax=Hufsiella arboris TaxID=2695275 RepID=A0A7K1YA86_9SPHI|nr:carboxypeptidase-like regulatory domain-containing protein [Hufsiella arboris]MXV51497.1 hypothetical protein [Hufsiella arboris]